MRFLVSSSRNIYSVDHAKAKQQIWKTELKVESSLKPCQRKMSIFHVRSNSLPSTSHLLISEFDEHIYRLRDSQATSTSSSSSSSIAQKLNGIQDLQQCIDNLLLLQQTQQALAHEQSKKWINELLDGSIRLLDLCNIAKDVFSQTKDLTNELQSIMHRGQGGHQLDLPTEVSKYLALRKVTKKAIKKALKNLKGLENQCSFFSVGNNNGTTLVNMLREPQTITLDVLKSLLNFVSVTQAKPSQAIGHQFPRSCTTKDHKHGRKGNSRQMNSKWLMLRWKLLSGARQTTVLTVSLIENVKTDLKNLEIYIEDLKQGTECLFRRMIKTRVSLLNILS